MRMLPLDYAVRNLSRSVTRLILAVSGSALVVALLLLAGGFVRGMDLALRSSGEVHNVILLGAGSEESIERSEVDSAVAGLAAISIPGIRSRAGVDYVSAEVHVQLPLRVAPDQPQSPMVLVRGVTNAAMLVHSALRIVEGRAPRPGFHEIIVGSMLATKMRTDAADVSIGKKLWIDRQEWTVVGRFSAPGTVMDAEVWAPLSDVKTATKRDTDSCVILTLDPALAEFADVDLFTKMRVDLELAAMSEAGYYAKLAQFFGPIRMLAWVTAGLVALGGLFGGLNTMYAAFAARVRELGTLQACGYRRSAILLSLMQESVLASACGTLLACAVALWVLDGVAVRFSLGAFGLRIDAFVLTVGLAAGLLLGIAGALPPAWRCLRLEIPVALKAV